MAHWSNWAGNVIAGPKRIVAPATLEDLRGELAGALREGLNVRVAGSGHSFAPLCQTGGLLIVLQALSGIEAVDPDTGEVTLWAGTKIHKIGEPLLRAGRALANQGDIDRQAIAGAVATGTHGTGRKYGSFSNAVRALELMTPTGNLVSIDLASGQAVLPAAALSLGLFGIVTRITLSTVPAYKLHERSVALDFEDALDCYPSIEADNRNAEFWWIPPLDKCVVKTLVETGEEPFSSPELEHPPGTLERYLKPEKVDWSYRVYPSTRSQLFVECEYTLPIANGPEAMRSVRKLVQTRHLEVRWAVEYRTLAGESHVLSPTGDEDSVTISVHQAADQPWEAFMRDCDALFREHDGRPHWGKLHWLARDDVEALYPGIETFRRIRREFDPTGVFLNDHLRPLFE